MPKSFHWCQPVICENLTEDTIYNGEIGIVCTEVYDGRCTIDIVTLETTVSVNIKPENIIHICAYCDTPRPPKKCSQCHVARFCDESCHKAAWKKHKQICGDMKEDLRFNKILAREGKKPLHYHFTKSHDDVN